MQIALALFAMLSRLYIPTVHFIGTTGEIVDRRALTATLRITLSTTSMVAACGAINAIADSYTLGRSVIAAGSATLQGGHFTIKGTLGQPAIGSQAGGAYSVDNGFWSGTTSPDDRIFANGFEL